MPWVPRVSSAQSRPRARERRRVPGALPPRGRRRRSSRFILVVEGSIPNETNKAEGYWAAFGTDPADRASRSRPASGSIAWRRRPGRSSPPAPARPTAASTPWQGNPTGCMGLPDYLGWDWKSKAGIPIVCVPGLPGAAGQLHGDAALPAAPGGRPCADDPARRRAAAHAGCSARRCTKAATAAATTSRPNSPTTTARRTASSSSAAGDRSCSATSANAAGWRGIGGCPNVGGICIGCTMPGFPDKFMPFMDQPPGSLLSSAAVHDLRTGDPTRCADSPRLR